jgi:hypothetical protein
MKEFKNGEPVGWCCGDTKNMLKDVINELDPDCGAEIGSFKGQSAYYMCETSEKLLLVCIDHWQGSPEHVARGMNLDNLYETFIDNTKKHQKRIIPVRMPSSEGLPRLAQICIPSFIFIDGLHTYSGVCHDITLATHLFPKAILCGDDYNQDSVKKAVHDCADGRKIKDFNGRAWRYE